MHLSPNEARQQAGVHRRDGRGQINLPIDPQTTRGRGFCSVADLLQFRCCALRTSWMTTLARAATINKAAIDTKAEPTRYQNGAKDDHKRNDACDAPFPLATPVSYFAVAQDIDNPVLAILFPEIDEHGHDRSLRDTCR